MTAATGPAGGGPDPRDVAGTDRRGPASAPTADVVPGGVLTRRPAGSAFEVHLDVFSGPFDLLLGLIAKHRLDITEIALAEVTDEFIAHIRAGQESGRGWDLSQASEFLLVAATLLDLKAARLLPSSGPEDEEDLALIEARDLLFARLLQYRAFRDISRTFADRMAGAGRVHPRRAGLEPRFAALLPELVITVSPEQLARIAGGALAPRPVPTVGLGHLHAPTVSVREQAVLVGTRLRRERVCSFRALVADADSTPVIIARFLAVLELYRDGAVGLEQAESLGELTVRWTGPLEGRIDVDAEFEDDTDHAEDSGDTSDEDQPGTGADAGKRPETEDHQA